MAFSFDLDLSFMTEEDKARTCIEFADCIGVEPTLLYTKGMQRVSKDDLSNHDNYEEDFIDRYVDIVLCNYSNINKYLGRVSFGYPNYPDDQYYDFSCSNGKVKALYKYISPDADLGSCPECESTNFEFDIDSLTIENYRDYVAVCPDCGFKINCEENGIEVSEKSYSDKGEIDNSEKMKARIAELITS